MARLHHGLMRELIEEIVTGQLAPGDMLPRELDLAERFDVSRGVAREGIRALEERGLVSVKHGKGATVNEPALWSALDEDVLDIMIASGASERLAEVLECQRMFEVQAAGLAATRASEADLSQLDEAIRQMSVSADRVESNRSSAGRYQDARLAYHQSVIGGTRNGALCSLTESIHAAVLTARFWLARPEYRMERAMPEHRAILAAVAAHDRDAARDAMARHLTTIESYITAHNGAGAVRPAQR
ncbi:FadR/GntR family transcriptional regulator [Conexibacter stalactiti]|uniref:FadR/GntR family transcriptional regulator n=1 Tax=Conexibacter stalactiti TaxID=1940611 RepID=A0ABU4HJ72_9ACTN|nr:FadR/GntR family transcriptional regulator [Conexibacter stalactiti]MDW5593365.1 FadR/GntR family transcriptional regulator [Conexibacter stalactiti]MEC5034006.1 FadR/GntR family transcriptional regulator [Conexibacter stalactiti]